MTIPTTLTATLSSACSCLNASWTLTYDPIAKNWTGAVSLPTCSISVSIILYCNNPQNPEDTGWWIVEGGDSGFVGHPTTTSCSPFQLTVSNIAFQDLSPTCPGIQHADLTITF